MLQKVCVIGSATWDVFFTTPQAKVGRLKKTDWLMFPYGGKIDARDVRYGFGGGAANVSVSLSKLGLPVRIITRLGNDWRAKEVLANLKKFKVDSSLIERDRYLPTPLSFIATSGGSRDHVAFIDRAASKNLILPSQLKSDITWCYLTSLANGDWPQATERLFKTMARSGQKIFWNPGNRQLMDYKSLSKLLPYLTVLDLNKEEAESLLKSFHIKFNGLGSLLAGLKKLGPQQIIITDGGAGAYYFDGQRMLFQPVFRIKPTNTTGAGDAFGSGWLAGYIYSGGNIKQAMLWGMRNATSVIKSVGAQNGLLTKEKMRGLLLS